MGVAPSAVAVLVSDRSFWANRRVLVTGHTGFKGTWLMFWLRTRGADVHGLSLPPAEPSLSALLDLADGPDAFVDINDPAGVRARMTHLQPEIVFHLAAQAQVRPSYADPMTTFATNILGTAGVLDAVRHTPSVRAVVSIASDKCYEDAGDGRSHAETDPLGGHDPYSASKGAAEIVTAAMRRSYFKPVRPDGHPAQIASVRAGNVIGGGDWATDRLVPDIVRAALGGSGTVTLRAPQAIRPWQHVLDPLAGYLALAERLHGGDATVADAFNFGPDRADARSVEEVASALVDALGTGRVRDDEAAVALHETPVLLLDSARARSELGWRPRLDFAEAIRLTAEWYAACHRGEEMRAVTGAQIAHFEMLGSVG